MAYDYDLLEYQLRTIGRTRAMGQKKELLKIVLASPDAREVMRFAYDPMIKFGVGKETIDKAIKVALDIKSVSHDQQFSDADWELLELLKSRELTGNDAIDAIAIRYAALTSNSWELLQNILLKDLRIGAGVSTLNECSPIELVREFSVMRAHHLEKHRVKYPVAIEPKLDGMRILAFVDAEFNVKFFSREGHEQVTLDALVPNVLTLVEAFIEQNPEFLNGIILDGEVVNGDFYDGIGEVRKKSGEATKAVYSVFNYFTEQEFWAKKGSTEYRQIRRNLAEAAKALPKDSNVQIIRSFIIGSEFELFNTYENFRDLGFEGAMVKTLDHTYVGRKGYLWQKMKAKEEVDVRVIDIIAGTGKNEFRTGALVVDFNGVEVNVSNMTDELREEFWQHPEKVIGKIIEVEYHETTPDGSMRHPRFKRIRTDKSVGDYEEPKTQQFEEEEEEAA